MSKDYILHFQPEIPQIIVGQEGKDGQLRILTVIKGQESLEIIERLTRGGVVNDTRRGSKTTKA